MGFLDFIKQKIFKKFNKNKGLPEGKESIKYENNIDRGTKNTAISTNSDKVQQTNIEQNKFENSVKVNYIPKPRTLDVALEQYLFGMLYQIKQNGIFSSYRVLTELSSLDNSNPGNNAHNEEIVLENVLRNGNLELKQQTNSNGMLAFNHIMSKETRKEHDSRIYINCKRENVAELADKFIKEFGNKPFYFKFCSDNQSAKKSRSEQFVFYTNSESDELNDVMKTIERTKQKYPKLFEGAQNVNPFMKNFDGYIAYAPEVTGIFVGLDGRKRPIDRSYNTLLSEALEDSFIYSIRDIVSKDYALTEKMGGKVQTDARTYATEVLEDVVSSPNRLKNLIKEMKINLSKECIRNPELDINGIDLSKNKEKELSYV